MKFNQLIEARKSVREYEKKKIREEQLKELKEFSKQIKGLIHDIQAHYIYIDEGWHKGEVMQGKVGYKGNPVLAPHYVAFISEEKSGYLQNSGYVIEQLVLKMTEMGLGSCWLSVKEEDSDEVKTALGINEKGKLVALVSFGYSKAKLPFTPKSTSTRVALNEFVFQGKWGQSPWLEELEMRGIANILHNIRLAPSWANRQPWKLILDKDEIILVVGGENVDNKHLLLDAGIMMLYMEKCFHEEGLVTKWTIYNEQDQKDYGQYEIPKGYQVIGTLHI